jgi:uncharacterized protein (DUF433 family)
MRVRGTWVTLETVLAAFAEGATAAVIAQRYPSIPLADVYQVIGYGLRHCSGWTKTSIPTAPLPASVFITEAIGLVGPSNDAIRESDLDPPDRFLPFAGRQESLAPAGSGNTETVVGNTEEDVDNSSTRVHVAIALAFVIENKRNAALR